jgi:hypothetical protein
MLAAGLVLSASGAVAAPGGGAQAAHHPQRRSRTPIKHVVVIFQENVSFDHSFASAGFEQKVPNSTNQGLCDAVHPVGKFLGGTGQWGYKEDFIPHHEPFQYYATTANRIT